MCHPSRTPLRLRSLRSAPLLVASTIRPLGPPTARDRVRNGFSLGRHSGRDLRSKSRPSTARWRPYSEPAKHRHAISRSRSVSVYTVRLHGVEAGGATICGHSASGISTSNGFDAFIRWRFELAGMRSLACSSHLTSSQAQTDSITCCIDLCADIKRSALIKLRNFFFESLERIYMESSSRKPCSSRLSNFRMISWFPHFAV
jgi:hypothetical protein